MSQSIEYVVALGGEIDNKDWATVWCDEQTSENIKSILNLTEKKGMRFEWTFDDGSIGVLRSSGRYHKEPYYFMGYSIKESNAIRYRRSNPTPDTSKE